MEEYEDEGNNARDVCNAIALIAEQEYEAHPQTQQYQLGVEAKINQELDRGILKATSGNVAKRVKIRQDARDTKERPSNITALQMIVKQEADEKAQLEEWKTELMAVLASEISQLHKAHEEAVEAQYLEMDKQRDFFVGKIEALREELKEVKKEKVESEKQASIDIEESIRGTSMAIEEESSSQNRNWGGKSPTSTPTNLNIKP